jgi:hypothetical protein
MSLSRSSFRWIRLVAVSALFAGSSVAVAARFEPGAWALGLAEGDAAAPSSPPAAADGAFGALEGRVTGATGSLGGSASAIEQSLAAATAAKDMAKIPCEQQKKQKMDIAMRAAQDRVTNFSTAKNAGNMAEATKNVQFLEALAKRADELAQKNCSGVNEQTAEVTNVVTTVETAEDTLIGKDPTNVRTPAVNGAEALGNDPFGNGAKDLFNEPEGDGLSPDFTPQNPYVDSSLEDLLDGYPPLDSVDTPTITPPSSIVPTSPVR